MHIATKRWIKVFFIDIKNHYMIEGRAWKKQDTKEDEKTWSLLLEIHCRFFEGWSQIRFGSLNYCFDYSLHTDGRFNNDFFSVDLFGLSLSISLGVFPFFFFSSGSRSTMLLRFYYGFYSEKAWATLPLHLTNPSL